MSDITADAADLRLHVTTLLRRYPDLRPGETDELLTFFTSGPLVDRGMLRGESGLRPIIEQIERDHPARFRAGVSRSLFVAFLLLAPIALFWWVAMKYAA
ncbi:hypothetical protein ACFSC3_12570 [Sphingomonas floccifaciens]|uniref:Uncharacterized protein n=1 Tax=Sphingomonas floccifaciens TaxID=1844115 RepID=A0ABW4NEJ3_9SPHN